MVEYYSEAVTQLREEVALKKEPLFGNAREER